MNYNLFFFTRQTEEQYIFIHDALLEAVTCGETEVAVRNLPMHIQQLSQMDAGTTVTGMELEFKVPILNKTVRFLCTKRTFFYLCIVYVFVLSYCQNF